MIVVVGSRHDKVAAALAATWPGAAVCSAEDICRPGWNWGTDALPRPRWVVDGCIVGDDEITGVFIRRSTVYPEEFLSTHADDRGYLAAEAHAFLVYVLSATRAKVVNPVADGSFGDDAIRLERWMEPASAMGIRVAPLRLTDRPRRARPLKPVVVEVAGGETFGNAPRDARSAALRLARLIGLEWATVVFDTRHRVLTVTSSKPPSAEAAAALGALLRARPRA